MIKQKLELLIIEDSLQHLEDAKEAAVSQEETNKDFLYSCEIDYVSTLSEAKLNLARKKYDGIVSDVFFPDGQDERVAREECYSTLIQMYEKSLETYPNCSITRNRLIDVKRQATEGFIPPLGVCIAEYALAEDMPLVLCTSTNHHGDKTQPVSDYCEKNKIDMVDTNNATVRDLGLDRNCEHTSKSWGSAFYRLSRKIVEKLT